MKPLHTVDPQTLGSTVQNVVATATLGPGIGAPEILPPGIFSALPVCSIAE